MNKFKIYDSFNLVNWVPDAQYRHAINTQKFYISQTLTVLVLHVMFLFHWFCYNLFVMCWKLLPSLPTPKEKKRKDVLKQRDQPRLVRNRCKLVFKSSTNDGGGIMQSSRGPAGSSARECVSRSNGPNKTDGKIFRRHLPEIIYLCSEDKQESTDRDVVEG